MRLFLPSFLLLFSLFLKCLVDAVGVVTLHRNASVASKIDAIVQLNDIFGDGSSCRVEVTRRPDGSQILRCKTPISYIGIPPVLHTMWKSDSINTHSSDAVFCHRSQLEFAPEFLHVHWTDKNIHYFIDKHYPRFIEYYELLNMNIKRSDLARYLILYTFGGVYLDLDIELKKPLRLLLKNNEPQKPILFFTYQSREFERSKKPFAGNAIFGTVRGGEVLSLVVQHLINHEVHT